MIAAIKEVLSLFGHLNKYNVVLRYSTSVDILTTSSGRFGARGSILHKYISRSVFLGEESSNKGLGRRARITVNLTLTVLGPIMLSMIYLCGPYSSV